MAFLRVNESPKLIHLDITRTHALDAGIEHGLCLLASENQKGHDRLLVKPGDARCSPDTHSFKQQREYLNRIAEINVTIAEGLRAISAMRFRYSLCCLKE